MNSSTSDDFPLQTGYNKPTRRDKRVYVCTYPECGYFSKSIKQFKSHHDDTHTLHCGCYVTDKTRNTHKCSETCSERTEKLKFDPNNLQLGIFSRVDYSFGGSISEYMYKYNESVVSLTAALGIVRDSLVNLFTQYLHYFKTIKVEVTTSVSLLKMEKEEIIFRFLRSGSHQIINPRFINDVLQFIEDILIASLSIFLDGGSNFSLVSVNDCYVKIIQHLPIKPRGFIPTPKEVLKRRGFCNIRATKGNCFLLSVLCCLDEYRNKIKLPEQGNRSFEDLTINEQKRLRKMWTNELSYVPIISEIRKTKSLSIDNFFDCSIDDIHSFQSQNLIGVCVFELIGKSIVPVCLPDQKYDKTVHLLMISELEMKEDDNFSTYECALKNYHYISLYNFSKFLGKGKGGHRVCVCSYCLNSFPPNSFEAHVDECRMISKSKYKFFSDPNTRYKFRKIYAAQSLDVAIFYSLKLLNEKLPVTNNNSPDFLYTRRVSNLHVTNYSLAVVDLDKPQILYSEESSNNVTILEDFIKHIMYTAEVCANLVEKTYKKISMSNEQKIAHKQATNCSMCKRSFVDDPTLIKTAHHSHFSGKYFNAVCSCCNINCERKVVINVYTHDETGAIFNFILKSLTPRLVSKVDIIPKGGPTKYTGLILSKYIKFINTYNFLPTTISEAISSLRGDGTNKELEAFNLLRQGTFSRSEQACKIFTKDFTDPFLSFENQTGQFKRLPKRELMINYLDGSIPSKEQYETYLQVWDTFQIKTFNQFLSLYSKVEMLMIADIFVQFNQFCMRHLGLSPTHYYSLASFVFDSAMFQCVYMKGNKGYQIITSPLVAKLIDDGKRGGIILLSEKVVKSNNNITMNFNGDEENMKFITALDINSAYSQNLLAPLPYDNFKYYNQHEIQQSNIVNQILNQSDSSSMQALLRCDLKYPKLLSTGHGNLPFAPSRCMLTSELLSEYQKQLYSDVYDRSPSDINICKLVLSFDDKTDYVVYSNNLRYYLSKGLLLQNVTEVLTFEVKPYLRPFVEKNLQLRAEAKTPFQIDLIKRLNNSLFGSLGPNYATRSNVKICFSRRECLDLVAKHSFRRLDILTSHSVLIELAKGPTLYTHPQIQFQVVLELSKLELYKLFYDKILCAFPYEKVKLVYCDTDSMYLSFNLSQRIFYDGLKALADDVLDCSSLPQSSFLYSEKNRGKTGCLKFVYKSVAPIIEFIALRVKCFSILLQCNECIELNQQCERCIFVPRNNHVKRFSGLPMFSIRKLTHELYKNIVDKELIQSISFKTIESRNAVPAVYDNTRTIFHNLDLSRYWISPNKSVPYGSLNIPSEKVE